MPGPRRSAPPRVLGPYEVVRNGERRYRLIAINAAGDRSSSEVGTEEDADDLKRELERGLERIAGLTVEQAILSFKQRRMLGEQRNLSASAERKLLRLYDFYGPVLRKPLLSLTAERHDELYLGKYDKKTGDRIEDGLIHRWTRFKRPPSVVSHRNALFAAKDFSRWCVKAGFLPRDLCAAVEPVGVSNAGKPKLNIDQANKFMAWACQLIVQGDVGAVAAMLALVVGLRASEITGLTPSSIDADCTVVRVIRGKTRRATRPLQLPVEMEIGRLLSAALRSLCAGKSAGDLIFPSERGGRRAKEWPRAQALRICRAAGLPEVGAHGLRGTHLSMAEEHGTTPEMMLRSAGHESRGVQHSAYLAPGATERGLQRRFLMKVVEGGVPTVDSKAVAWRARGIKVKRSAG